MGQDDRLVASALKSWNASIERANKLFTTLPDEALQQEIAPGKNRLIYVWGHLTAVHDRMLPLLGLGERLHPEFDAVFLTAADRAVDPPPVETIRRAWDRVNGKLEERFATLSAADWLDKHTAVSDEDFAQNPARHRFSVLLSRTGHIEYHLGQAALIPKPA